MAASGPRTDNRKPKRRTVLKAPALSGWALAIFTRIFESPLGLLIYPIIAHQSNLPQVLTGFRIPEAPLFRPHLPISCAPEAGCSDLGSPDGDGVAAVRRAAVALFLPDAAATDSAGDGLLAGAVAGRPTAADYAVAFKAGSTTPSEVAERLIAFITQVEALPCHSRWLLAWNAQDIRFQAAASSARWRDGVPLSPLDGVPFAVKDFIDALPYATTAGTTFVAAQRPVFADCPYVAALKAAGAVLLGKAAAHEIGLGITGRNDRVGTPRNPYAGAGGTALCGGSSSGSAALLAAGVCPIAVGSDGGGSIRIPASFCGCVGLLPTFGRITDAHTVEIGNTVGMAGPMGGSVADVALLYAAMGNVGLDAPWGQTLPPPMRLPSPLPGRASTEADQALAGLSIGLYGKVGPGVRPAIY